MVGISKALVITPDKLNTYIGEETKGINHSRYFVNNVKKYLDSVSSRVLLITGLRSTGKTIGILQAIKNTDTTYISPIYKGSCTEDDIKDILINTVSRNIVIDEYSWITGSSDSLANFIAGLTKTGKKIILTGTESAVIHGLQSSELIHRAIEIHTNYCSYEEYRKIFDLSLNSDTMLKYLQSGGIFESKINESFGNMRNYIQTAIINNIAAFLPEYDINQIKLGVYTYFYNCITENYKPVSIPVYNYEKTELSFEEYLDDFGIKTDISIDKNTFNEISNVLESLQIAVKLEDIRIPNHTRIYIVNQALSYNLVKAIYQLDTVSDKYLGHLYEASVVCNFYFNKPSVYDMYFLEGRKRGIDYEIDFILKDKTEAYIFECKYSKNDNFELSETASIAKDIIPNILGDCDVSGRIVIYQGNSKTGITNGKDIIYTNDWNIDYEHFDDLLKTLHPNMIIE